MSISLFRFSKFILPIIFGVTFFLLASISYANALSCGVGTDFKLEDARSCSCPDESYSRKCIERVVDKIYSCSCIKGGEDQWLDRDSNPIEAPPAPLVGSQSTGNVGIQYQLQNPLGQIDSFTELLEAILYVFIVIATPIIVMAIIYAGFLYVTARGNVEQTKQATTALTYAIIGGVILLGSVAIADIVENIVEDFTTNE